MLRAALLCLSVGFLLALSGCYAATAAIIWGILALTESDEGGDAPDVPRVADLAVLPSLGVPRAFDLNSVQIRFKLLERTGEPADVTMEFLRDGWERARIEDPLTGLSTSSDGSITTLTWNAAADGFSGYVEVDLRVTARDKDGAGASSVKRVFIGNDAPQVTLVEVDAGEEGSEVVRDTVVVRFELEDRARDESWIDFFVARPGEDFELVCADPSTQEGAACPDILVGQRKELLPGAHDFAWNTKETLGSKDLDHVRVAIRARDFPNSTLGATGDLKPSAEFSVRNNSPPDVVVIEAVANPDAYGPCLLQFLLRDAEADQADVVLQWAENREDFASDPAFDLSELSDPEVRRRVVLDPDERSLRRIITPRLRTVMEARVRLVKGLAENEVALWGIDPPRPITDAALRGHALELLSEWGAVEATGSIAGADPVSEPVWGKIRLERALDSSPQEGQRARVREAPEGLSFGLETAKIGEGSSHEMAWDVPADVGGRGQSGHYFVRAMAFNAGVRSEWASFATTVAKPLAVRMPRFVLHPEPPRTGSAPACVTAADLNGDGRLDIVSADSGARQLSVFLGQGGGSFAAHSDPPRTGLSPLSVVAADLDGDGRLDLVSADMDENRLSVFLGRGDGSFVPHSVRPSTGLSPQSVIAADLDGDGRPDLVSGDYYANQLSVFLNRGGGSFQAHAVHPPTGSRPSCVIAADLDSDGHLDLVSADSGASQLSVFLGRGDGSLMAPTHVPTGPRPLFVAAADFNADGRLDLASVDSDVRQISVCLRRGDGSFVLHPEHPRTGRYPTSVIAADLDGDGHPDLVSADDLSKGEGQLSVFLGRGDGSFVECPEYPITGRYPTSVIAADLDGDGRPDLVSADKKADQLSVFLSRGDGSFTAHPEYPSTGSGPVSVAAADLDGDGRLDLVSADANESQLSVLLGRGDGSFVAHPEHPHTGSGPLCVAAADFNGDGWPDLASADTNANRLSVFLGRGDGSFAACPELPPTGSRLTWAVTGDLNGDGCPDLAAACVSEKKLWVFLGRGDGSFVAHPDHPPTASGPVSVAAADLNGDGRLDLVSADIDVDQLSVFLGRGDGSFDRLPRPLITGVRPSFATAADFDGDGHCDLVSADSSDDQLSVFLGRGDGSFVAHPEHPRTGSGPQFVAAADLDGDGRIDLVTADTDRLLVFLGRGDGSFVAQPEDLRIGSGPSSATAADFNGDGRPDLVSADAYRLAVFLNAGTYPLSPSLGPPRARAPTVGGGRGGSLDGSILTPRSEPYFLDASGGTLDGRPMEAYQRPGAYQGHAFHFASIVVPEGVTLQGTGVEPIVLLSTGNVTISGTLDLRGVAGRDAGPAVGGNGNAGGAGGAAAPGGASGGAGGGTDPGSGSIHGRPGFGPGGGGGARHAQGSRGPASGGGGGFSESGEEGLAAGADGAMAARGGSAHGNSAIDPVYGGSGGGGGSIREGSGGARGALDNGDAQGQRGDLGGGGGGGGGGALRITAGGSIVLTASGKILADGGRGGRGREGAEGTGGHGGGGSGGAILLQAYGEVRIEPGAVLSARGGSGGSGGTSPVGGGGAAGRIRFEDSDGQVEVQGEVFPEPAVGRLPPEPEEPYGGAQVPGDLNQDGKLELADAIGLFRLLFVGSGQELPCGGSTLQEGGNLALLDSDGSGRVDLTDGLRVLFYLFQSGAPPVLGVECVAIAGCPEVCAAGG